MTIFAGSPIETIDSSSRIRLFNINNKKLYLGAFVVKADEELLDLFIRLLKLNDRLKNAYFLGELIKREMIYHILTGEYGYLFFSRQLLKSRLME
ncbi:AraC family transcriptional regulator N-terminal domain-containing protein [Clostridium beijerinckii]|uniref:AraC family transcriptional regulator N-terminal domain-containing protein n=1 Tax=Clostridium beijerinckii TaxID=1520 RepID=UPI001FA92663|nr:AraC family transcriptional regulator N-terminal domain-containing protein [Clostridium beijerinckii]